MKSKPLNVFGQYKTINESREISALKAIGKSEIALALRFPLRATFIHCFFNDLCKFKPRVCERQTSSDSFEVEDLNFKFYDSIKHGAP